MMVYSCGWSRVLFLYIVGCLDCAELVAPALAACDAGVLSCSFSQVLVHCSPEFSQTCCIDIQALCLIPITALPFLLPPSETCSVQEKMALSVLLWYFCCMKHVNCPSKQIIMCVLRCSALYSYSVTTVQFLSSLFQLPLPALLQRNQ